MEQNKTGKIFYMFSELFKANFINSKISYGTLKAKWVSMHKPFGLIFLDKECVFRFDSVQLNIKRALFFLFKLFSTTTKAQVLFVNGAIATNDSIDFLKNIFVGGTVTYKFAHVIRWFPGMLTNLREMGLTYFRPMGAAARARRARRRIAMKNKLKDLTYVSNFEGLNLLETMPDVLIFFSLGFSLQAAAREAEALGIPTVGICNSDSTFLPCDFIIPGNDKSFVSLVFFFKLFGEAILRGMRHNLLNEEIGKELAIHIDERKDEEEETKRRIMLENRLNVSGYLTHSKQIQKIHRLLLRADLFTKLRTVVESVKLKLKVKNIIIKNRPKQKQRAKIKFFFGSFFYFYTANKLVYSGRVFGRAAVGRKGRK